MRFAVRFTTPRPERAPADRRLPYMPDLTSTGRMIFPKAVSQGDFLLRLRILEGAPERM
jgi:hypothetical protein